jgi:hypothetical protein
MFSFTDFKQNPNSDIYIRMANMKTQGYNEADYTIEAHTF